ncbi:cyclohexadienyl dehydratase [Paenibacillus faecis]|uniref:Transporter substrate-binding domain-containing protein n=1 Tax=Paenibacillus faecis TaxID=862114 RepID=A0A5D0CS68_9BACL|nr:MULTISPECIES: transporter substrate-binding domain-containing protein [Paenibacillus]MCA1293521.1 transporter substrate-binding domain-containing protein [Paenibacillus sp. alder61]TYA12164.1 transporter substrate-binding domain-containing protein [Paenibacillus faecis]GIO88618.1 cyclohexadienyl dehydratase [Paenibacillus faecis]
MLKNWKKVLIAGVMTLSLVGTGYVGHDLIAAQHVSAASAASNAPGQEKKAAASQLDAIIERGYIRVGMTGDYKPFTYLNPKTNEFEGYDVDAAKELAKDLGVEVRFVKTTWSDMMKDLQADKFDIAVGGVTRNTARQKTAYVSQGYVTFGKAPLIRAEDKDKYKTLEDINKPSVRIGVNPGGTNEVFVRQHLTKANVTVVENNLDIPHLVADGTYDVMITDTVEAMTYAKADSRLYAALTDKPFTKSEKGFMIPRGDFVYASYLEMWMDEMKLQGKFDALFKKWME